MIVLTSGDIEPWTQRATLVNPADSVASRHRLGFVRRLNRRASSSCLVVVPQGTRQPTEPGLWVLIHCLD